MFRAEAVCLLRVWGGGPAGWLSNRRNISVIAIVLAVLLVLASLLFAGNAFGDTQERKVNAGVSEKVTATVDDSGKVTIAQGTIKNSDTLLGIGIRKVSTTSSVDLSDATLKVKLGDKTIYSVKIGTANTSKDYVTVPKNSSAKLTYEISISADKAKSLIGKAPISINTTIDVVSAPTGKVTDKNGAAVPNAKIVVTYTDPYTQQERTFTTTSDKNGSYTLEPMMYGTSGVIEITDSDGRIVKKSFTADEKEAVAEAVVCEKTEVPAAVTGLVYTGTEQTGVTETAGVTLTGNKATDAGSYTAKATLKAGYVWTDGTSGEKSINWSISQKQVTVTANDLSKVYGESDPVLTAEVSGTIGQDTVDYTLSRKEGEDAGTYDITPAGDASQGNYNVSFIKGTFTILQKQVSVTGVSLDQTQASINKGSTVTLKATVAPDDATNKNVTWSSSDENVATVSDSGVVTAVKEGSATITVTTQDGGYTATCEVTVTSAIIHVTSVALDKSDITIEAGATDTLTASVKPDNATSKEVAWSSSDASVASVDNQGVVTGVGAGTADITVTTEDGGYTATCKVTVIIHVTAVELDKNSITINVGDTDTLTASVIPDSATNKNVTWSSNNTSVAKVSDSGLVTGVGKGTATITVKTEDRGYTAECVVKVE